MVMRLTGARLAAVALLLLAVPLVVEAQPAGKIYGIGILGEKAADLGKLVCGRPSGSSWGSEAGSKARTF